jgi:hypothetical protein
MVSGQRNHRKQPPRIVSEKSIGAVQNTHTRRIQRPETQKGEGTHPVQVPTHPTWQPVALIPHLPPAPAPPDSLPDAAFDPAPPSATWHPVRRCFGKNSPDEPPAAAVFFLSAASSDAHGWSPGTCRRHHRTEGFTVDPTSSTPRSVPPLPHPTRLRLQFHFFSRPGHPLAIRFLIIFPNNLILKKGILMMRKR